MKRKTKELKKFFAVSANINENARRVVPRVTVSWAYVPWLNRTIITKNIKNHTATTRNEDNASTILSKSETLRDNHLRSVYTFTQRSTTQSRVSTVVLLGSNIFLIIAIPSWSSGSSARPKELIFRLAPFELYVAYSAKSACPRRIAAYEIKWGGAHEYESK